MKKIMIILLAALLILMAAGCQSNSEPIPDEVKNGKTQTTGTVSVLVPEGYVLTESSINADEPAETDMKQFYLSPENSPSEFHYIWVVLQENEEDCVYSCSVTKDVNEGEDCSFSTSNKVEWKGCSYRFDSASEGTIPCGQVYAKSGEQIYLVSYAGFESESAVLKAVLNSLKKAE